VQNKIDRVGGGLLSLGENHQVKNEKKKEIKKEDNKSKRSKGLRGPGTTNRGKNKAVCHEIRTKKGEVQEKKLGFGDSKWGRPIGGRGEIKNFQGGREAQSRITVDF